jgi:tRNA1Val (adenine37-N6)-methyltransferase
MSESVFRFKQFTVHQDRCVMKVGTDAVLLGSWVDVWEAKRILDIGTGTGIIAIMLAQKSSADIDAIDIDLDACMQAKENAIECAWSERISIHNISFQEFSMSTKKKYDLIVSNPPYFSDAPKPHTLERIQSRHTDLLSFDELASGVRKIISPAGKFCVVMPCREGKNFMDIALRYGLFSNKILHVRTVHGKEKRILLELSLQITPIKENEITIQNGERSFSKEYAELTREFFPG